ncbi:hypothetical protein WG908_06890 [Sphingobium sp. AN641]|uniref:hypothetical protein n=1 Tax=Sphingobium sp. AN641 TaxID=3133443 RepID=UPI0030BC0393
METIIAADRGYIPDDLVLDSRGGFYFTDFRGNNDKPIGGVLHVSPGSLRARATPVSRKLLHCKMVRAKPISLRQAGGECLFALSFLLY